MEATAAAPTPAPHVLVIPFPAQGHALPLLDITALLAARGLRVTVVTTPANLPLLSPLLAAHPDGARSRTFPFPSHPSLPAGRESTKDCGPEYFAVFIQALAALREPVRAWARAQKSDPVVAVIADFFCGWAQPLAAEIGAAGLVFSPSGVPGTAVPHSMFRRQLDEQVRESVRQELPLELESRDFVSNTFRALEGRYLDTPLEDLGFKRVWAVGPVAPEADAASARGGETAVAAANLAAWLDGFPDGSVVYVSFGSQAVLTPAVAAALAEALERSAVPFVWVVGAGNDGGGVVVPDGFEARARNVGMVVRGWAPQVAALRHVAVGWFVTHCGWNSVLEAVAAGLPMLAWPMSADQFVNARLLVDEARVAVRACAGGVGVAPDAGELAAVLADAVGEKGRELSVRARELAAEAARAVKEGGSSYNDLEALVQEIRKLS
ncbi:hypothetical protein EJB05_39935, partial [Eragrostis curvula]